MKNKIFNKNILISSLFVILIFSITLTSAFSVSTPYMENKQLNISLESKITDLQFVLQNGGGATENINIKVLILNGSEIISITDAEDVYLVAPGDKIPVNFKITLPEEVKNGDSYDIVLSFTTVTQGQSGEFGFGTGQEHKFKIVAVKEEIPKENKFKEATIYLIIGIIFLLIIIVNILIKKKNKKSK